MKHGIVEVVAYQETLLIMAVFAIAMLAMAWIGFRRWLQHKERMERLTAERPTQFGAQMERVEASLKAIERIVTDGAEAPPISALGTNSPGEPVLKPDQV